MKYKDFALELGFTEDALQKSFSKLSFGFSPAQCVTAFYCSDEISLEVTIGENEMRHSQVFVATVESVNDEAVITQYEKMSDALTHEEFESPSLENLIKITKLWQPPARRMMRQ